jgi:hypothetical protein
VSRTLVLLAGLPGMLREIVAASLASSPDLEVAELGAWPGESVADAVVRTEADVVIVSEPEDGMVARYERLLGAASRASLVVVTEDGRYACRLTPVRDVSPRGLVDAVRAAGAR